MYPLTNDTPRIELPDGPLRETDPAVQEEQEKLNDLAEAKTDVEERIRERRVVDDASRRQDQEDAAAEALLEGDGEGGTATKARPSVREELRELHQRRRVLDRAISKQRDRLEQAEKARAVEVAEEVEEDYRALMQEVADRLHELTGLVQEERRARDKLEALSPTGSVYLQTLPAPAPGRFWHNLQAELPGGEEGIAGIALDHIVSDYNLDDPRS